MKLKSRFYPILFSLTAFAAPAASAAGISAAERADTTAKELKEVVVKGRRQYAIDGGTVYIPTRNEKKAARNAQDLLNHIGITQIEVDPQTFSVKTLGGNDV